MKTYKLLNAIRYVDARTARRFIDASVGELEQTVVNSLGKFARTSIPGNASQTFGTEIVSICKSIIDGNGVGIADKIDAFAKSLKNFRQKNISAKNVIDGAKINTALQELKKQAAFLARGGAPAKSENRSAGWGKSKVRSPSNVSMVGRPEFVKPSLTWASMKSSVERWAQQSAKGLTLAKNGKVYYNGKPVNENNIPSSIAGLVEYYPNKEEAIKGINNILRTKLEQRRMSIVNAKKLKSKKVNSEEAAKANAYRLRNKNKLDPGLEEEFRNEGLSHSKSNYQRATAGKPDGQRQRKIDLANDIALLLGNKGLNASEYSNRKRIWAKHAPADDKALKEYNKSFDMSKGEQIDAKTARDAIAYIKSGISNLKMGNDRDASEDFWRSKKVLSKAGYRGKEFAKNFPSLNSGLNSLMTLIKRKDSGYSIRNRMTNSICYGYKQGDSIFRTRRFRRDADDLTKIDNLLGNTALELKKIRAGGLFEQAVRIKQKLASGKLFDPKKLSWSIFSLVLHIEDSMDKAKYDQERRAKNPMLHGGSDFAPKEFVKPLMLAKKALSIAEKQ